MNPLLKARIVDRMSMSHSRQTNSSTAATTAAQHPQQQHQHQHPGLADTNTNSPLLNNDNDNDHPFTEFDVINGRGLGVHRHPGNVKYRTLVFLNKVIYANCPVGDKLKISKGIVAAVRELGGRFLESKSDDDGCVYNDIGDKKAWAKTSQALREGQTKIRQSQEVGSSSSSCDSIVMPPSLISQADGGPLRTIHAEGYFRYTLQMLESLHKGKANDTESVPSQCPSGHQVLVSPCPSPPDKVLSLDELSRVSPCQLLEGERSQEKMSKEGPARGLLALIHAIDASTPQAAPLSLSL